LSRNVRIFTERGFSKNGLMASCLSLIGVATRIFAVLRLAVDALFRLADDALFDVRTVSGDKLFIDALLLLRRDAVFDEGTVSGDTLFSDALLERGDLPGDFSALGDIFSKI
jgi:hypothetical protein